MPLAQVAWRWRAAPRPTRPGLVTRDTARRSRVAWCCHGLVTPDTARLGDTGHGLALARCGGPLPLRTSRTISAALSDTASSPPAHGANQRRAKADMRGIPSPPLDKARRRKAGKREGGRGGGSSVLGPVCALGPCSPALACPRPELAHRRCSTVALSPPWGPRVHMSRPSKHPLGGLLGIDGA